MNDHGSAAKAHDDEPQTPMWLPALGAVFFFALGAAWAMSPSASNSTLAVGASAAGNGGPAPSPPIAGPTGQAGGAAVVPPPSPVRP